MHAILIKKCIFDTSDHLLLNCEGKNAKAAKAAYEICAVHGENAMQERTQHKS